MAQWLIYVRERFPLGTYLLLCMGFALSGNLLGGEAAEVKGVATAAFALFLFFAELRLMDEFKDYRKDLIAHPERPLPRGVLTLKEVQAAIYRLFLLMLILSVGVMFVFNLEAGVLNLFYTGYLWLMYKEFYIGKSLSRMPLAYAISHQIIVVPICLFTVAIRSPELAFKPETFAYSCTVLGAFFCYEVCRKLDPKANPILQTYLSVYGPGKTVLIASTLLILAAVGAFHFGAEKLLWPVEIFTALSLILIWFKPLKFKIVELAASISLICHIWSVPIQTFLR